MEKDKKPRSGSQSNEGRGNENGGDYRKTAQPGGPAKSNRQTGGGNRHERDDSNRGADHNTTKKGSNAI